MSEGKEEKIDTIKVKLEKGDDESVAVAMHYQLIPEERHFHFLERKKQCH